ncbi:hypothetical protein Poli38472_002213 [Pythium oligandrum]|uniref:Uncharacterized protein n=1 Tax=Pythium oligandrum TaxID=41045 RepID=A0A8K1FKX5_PYTOL|nr:hypothetical protein Poli38472_002213 [Pythium oligandrum]|eukprot:TMW63272.1 hypothetical protein Poli38472_002213 [Pythium oligandrum]
MRSVETESMMTTLPSSSTVRGRAPSMPERVIDVESDSPALLMEGSGRDDDQDDDEDSSSGDESESEHQYPRGRLAIPMESPGDDFQSELVLDSTAEDDQRRRAYGRPRRGNFFANEEDERQILQRVTLRRRKEDAKGDGDWFWTAIFVTNILSLAVMVCTMIYLTQTDFFESHQSDLFGTTVDNRFTVVAQENDNAKILLKSGYSNSRYAEAMVSFGSGKLKIGRRPLGGGDTQSFYGMSIFGNGSARFTNRVTAPFVKADYVHAAKAFVFEDGSVMTSAANMSSGGSSSVNEIGDLNLVSQSGSVSMSAGGFPVLQADPDGSVTVLDNEAEYPSAQGIKLDATNHLISIAGDFQIRHGQNSTSLSAREALRLDTTLLLVGKGSATKAVITCPPHKKHSSSDDGRTMELEVLGQSSKDQELGGNVVVRGGDGSIEGGRVRIDGGVAFTAEGEKRGRVMINAQLDPAVESKTEIGSHSVSHEVSLHGAVTINPGIDNKNPTSLTIGGTRVILGAKNITVDNSAVSRSQVQVHSRRVALTASSGPKSFATVELEGNEAVIDARDAVYVGGDARLVQLEGGDNATVALKKAGSIEINATAGITLRSTASQGSTTIIGKVVFREEDDKSFAPDLALSDGKIALDADAVVVGGAGETSSMRVNAKRIKIGALGQNSNIKIAGNTVQVNGATVTVGSQAAGVSMVGKTINIGSINGSLTIDNSGSTASIKAKSVSIDGKTVSLGTGNAESVIVGGADVSESALDAKTVDIGASATSVNVGSKAKSISIGSSRGTIDLKGKVTLNGEELSTRRRLASVDHVYGLAGSDQVQQQFAVGTCELPVHFDERFSSEDGAVQVLEDGLGISPDASATERQHIMLGLSLDNIRAPTTHEDGEKMRLRCRVYRTSQSGNEGVALEVTSNLDPCAGSACDGIFLGASNRRMVAYDSGDRFSVRCITSSTRAVTVFMDRVQLDFSNV